MSSRAIAVLPIGDVPEEDLKDLSKGLQRNLNLEIKILPARPLPSPSAADKKQGQYDAAPFMEMVSKEAGGIKSNYLRVLGVTGEDLYTPGLNFIFGQAEISGRAAVISTVRLKYNQFWIIGKRKLEPREVFVTRMIKEAVHELGHTFGLRHCERDTCVMHFSNRLEDTDHKSENYCRRCRKQIKNLN
ncbi:MAG: archaemetzincin family Zn-dependent metalloprotease [Thermoplasmata archaeon]|nr:MAG: archaemetzincin family Zn-dependent metalloprotease [Thermoplasmata archaeon]